MNKFVESLGADPKSLPHKTKAQTGEECPPKYTREELLQERAITEKAANAYLQDFLAKVEGLLSPPTKSDHNNNDHNNAIKAYILHDSWLPVFLQRIINTAKEAIGVKNSSQKLVENINDVSEKFKEISERYKALKRDRMPSNETDALQEKAANSPQP